MNKKQLAQQYDPVRTGKKILLSAFVVGAFSVYAIYERVTGAGVALNTSPGTAGQNSNTALSGHIKDGVYTGSEVDAYYGLVKVQTTIQGGKIADVQFLEYPRDRRTSVRINSIAVPDLQQESIQAQTANVDIISGATLTSEAFRISLQTALDAAAKN